MSTDDISETIDAIRFDVVQDTISQYIPPQSIEDMWDVPSLEERIKSDFQLDMPVSKWLEDDEELHEDTLRDKILNEVVAAYRAKEERVGPPVMRHFEKSVMLQLLDTQWKDHLGAMDQLRQGIHLRGYAQKNPKQEYKREAFELFTQLLDDVKSEVISILSKVQVQGESDVEKVDEQRRQQAESKDVNYQHAQASAIDEAAGSAGQQPAKKPVSQAPYVRSGRKVGRNDPCPCGSGKKYKQCHGKL